MLLDESLQVSQRAAESIRANEKDSRGTSKGESHCETQNENTILVQMITAQALLTLIAIYVLAMYNCVINGVVRNRFLESTIYAVCFF